MSAIPIFEAPKAPAIIRASKYWTPRLMAKEALAAGRKAGQTQGTHLDNLIECRRVLTLSPAAARKFTTPRGKSLCERKNYCMKRSMPIARAWCDATGDFHPGCLMFFPKELA